MTDPRSTFTPPSDLAELVSALVSGLVSGARRTWRLATTTPVPDYQPVPGLDPRGLRIRRLERVLDLLEATRRRVSEVGWVGGGWAVSMSAARGEASSDRPRFAGDAELRALLRRPADAGAACLVGSMLLLADDPDTAHSIADVWLATDALYESVHEAAGRVGFPPGHVWSPTDRRHHLRVLTGWNDEAGRTAGDVVGLLNRAISRTIAACVD